MSVAPLPHPRLPANRPGRADRRTPTPTSIVRRGQMVGGAKRLLPLLAVLLLGMIALWPQIARHADLGGGLRGLPGEMQAGKLVNMRYRGIDSRNRPYTVTASEARQDGADRVNLVDPKGDLLSENGSWTLVEAAAGVYLQRASVLDLSDHVVVYRDNGVTLSTPVATIDLKSGAADSNEATHAQGPFGTLDAQGFALVDKGAVIQFQGRSHLMLNGTGQ